MGIFSFKFWFFKLPLLCFLIFILWFIPWVFLLYSGILIYFPYKEDGITRYMRITGPITNLFSNEWINQKNIPNTCKAALIASEDSNFYEHNGVDFKSLKRSISENTKSNKIRKGGSTITQQLVKNAFLSRKKSYIRKIREVTGALALNIIMTKEKQLEWYFNIVEFGPNTYGLKNAAQKYFKIDAAKLSPPQCVALVTILPSPKKWNQSLEKKQITKFFAQRYKEISFNMTNMNLISKKEIQLVQSMNLGFSQQKFFDVPKSDIKSKDIPQETSSNENINDNENEINMDE